MPRRLVLGVDSSTQSTKVEARDLDTGEVVATGAARHPATTPPVSEQDPRAWWGALTEACARLGSCRSDVVSMSIAGQQHGLVLLDDAGEPVRPAKLWNDTTSAPEAEHLVGRLGADAWAAAIGSVPVPAFTITKLAWVAAHEPDALARATRVMLPHDYLTWRLTGEHVTDRGDASGSGWFDPVTDSERDDLRDFAAPGWAGSTPRVLGPSEAVGQILAPVAVELGLPESVLVGPGSGDNMGAALGLGLQPGDVAISLGTSGTAFARSATPTRDPSGAVAGFASASGDFLPLVCTMNATKVTDTVAGWLGTDAVGIGELALEGIGARGDAVLVPYFDGERTPNLPNATGTFVGLTNGTTREQIAVAAHDGVLCGLLDGRDALRDSGASVDGRILLVGGGARSAAYRQRCADLATRAVVVPDTDETVATGASVQAAVIAEAGTFDEIAAAWRLGAGVTIEPAADGTPIRARYADARRQVVEVVDAGRS